MLANSRKYTLVVKSIDLTPKDKWNSACCSLPESRMRHSMSLCLYIGEAILSFFHKGLECPSICSLHSCWANHGLSFRPWRIFILQCCHTPALRWSMATPRHLWRLHRTYKESVCKRSTVDSLNLCTDHTTVHPTLLANMTWVLGLKVLLRKLWASGLWKVALMLRRLRRASVGRMILCVWRKVRKDNWIEMWIPRVVCDE